jgi:hypothetical protein
MRQYNHNNLAGCVQQHRSRKTGTKVGVYNAEQSGLDPDAGPWVTVCEDHGFTVNHPTLALAREWAPDPTGWCDVCRDKAKAAEKPAEAPQEAPQEAPEEEDPLAKLQERVQELGLILDEGNLIDGPFIPDGTLRVHPPDDPFQILAQGEDPAEVLSDLNLRRDYAW